ncbi:hypothetical protein AAHH78_36045, partial [Burkholderia pseudomallei]
MGDDLGLLVAGLVIFVYGVVGEAVGVGGVLRFVVVRFGGRRGSRDVVGRSRYGYDVVGRV